ncbi:MAG: ABC transporter ATP-binding protein [Erysipelotrichaceae bacterium]|nr:ABC transporter ATP-binding protein [Erysipelotrichaceae bacterium]
MKLILKYLKKYKLLFVLDFISVFGFALADLGIPFLISQMIDQGVEMNDSYILFARFWGIVAAAGFGVFGMIMLCLLSTRISTNIVYDIRKDLFDHVMTLSHEQIQKFGVSSLITRTGSDPYQIMMFLNTLLRSALMTPVVVILSAALMMMTSMNLAWIVIAAMPLVVLEVIVVFAVARPLSERQQKSIDRINEILRDNMSGIRLIRTFNNQKLEEKRFEKENEKYRSATVPLFKLMNISKPLVFFMMNLASLVVYYFAAILIQNGQVQIGQLIAFMDYLFQAMMSILIFCLVFTMYPKAEVSARRIQEVLDAEPAIDLSQGGAELEPVTTLEFDHVQFAYPSADGLALQDISFQASAGQKIAVVGSTGSGKSTLGKLIPRFYEVTEGSIKINGRDVREYDPQSLRSRIGHISQKSHIFSGTVRDNLRFSCPQASEKQLEEAAGTAQALSFIQKRPGGFDSVISEEGGNLSGGQKQRLSIARGLMKNPGLYIFDDSFSALDFATDARLRSALAPLLQKSIFLIMAQRISTIVDADLIVVLDQGKTAGMGTHAHLFETCRVYRELVLSQACEQEVLTHA